LTDIINDQGMKIATLEHAVQELQQLLPKSNMPKELVEIRAARESCQTYFLSVLVFVDTPGLGCFDDFGNVLCIGKADLFDWMSMSLSSWAEAHEDLSELRLKSQSNTSTECLEPAPWTATGSNKQLSMHGKEL